MLRRNPTSHAGASQGGDGAVNQPSEECDDGNGVDTDSCVSGCQSAECGDGYLRAGVEVCDPGLDSSCLADCSGYSPGACTTLASCFGVEHQSDGSPTDNTILPRFILRNHGSTVINLTQVTLRYWFSAEGEPSPLTAVCDWAELLENTGIGGTTLVRMSITAVSSPDASATHYLDVSFATGAGSLNPGQSTGRIDMRVFPKDWANWNENNDYSNTGSTSFVVAPRVALYVAGTLVWGDVW